MPNGHLIYKHISKADVIRSVKSANFVIQFYRLTKVCRVTWKVGHFFVD